LAVSQLLAALPDGRLSVVDRVVAADPAGASVGIRAIIRGTQLLPLPGSPRTGLVRTLQLFATYRVEGRITQAWQSCDSYQWEVPASPEPVLELDEIQGNVFPGFNKDHLSLLSFALVEQTAAARTLGWLADEVATAAEVRAFNQLFATSRRRRGHEQTVLAAWCNVALSRSMLAELGAGVAQFQDRAFAEGFATRNGSAGAEPDLLLTVAADTEQLLQASIDRLLGQVQGLRLTGERRGATLSGSLTGHEHFGFLDGISQPALRGRSPYPPYESVSSWRQPTLNQALPGQDLVWPGEFIFGYPQQQPADPLVAGPDATAGPDWARNGSFLVYARYRQDRQRFDSFIANTTAELVGSDPALAGLTPDRLRAALTGRWLSGAPLLRAIDADLPALGADRWANNDFSYRAPGPGEPVAEPFPVAVADPDGRLCPYGAHVRRSNPRDDLGDRPAVQRHRILRRGIPFGRADSTDEQGLLFVCYQSSIERQFEFIVKEWLAKPQSDVPDEGSDPIVRPDGADASFGLRLPFGGAHTRPVPMGQPWTWLTEGAYLFVPSVSALRELGRSA